MCSAVVGNCDLAGERVRLKVYVGPDETTVSSPGRGRSLFVDFVSVVLFVC